MVVGWEEKRLGEVGVFSKGRGVRKDEAQSGKLPCVRYGELYTHHNDYIKRFNSYISEDVAAGSKALRSGDILFAGSGETKEEIGKCVAFVNNCEAYAGGDIVILTPKQEVSSLFLGFYLNTKPIAIQKASKGQGDAVVHISATSLADIEISLPPLPEQHRIAEAISDTDALISTLEKLIDKKRAIKQGAMQELLTGKRRLDGFSGEWVETTIGGLCGSNLSKGQIITESSRVHGTIPVIAGGKTFAYYHDEHNREANTITISASGASAGYVSFWTCKIFASDCSTIIASDEYDVKYLYYYLINRQADLYKMQTGGAQPHVQPSDISPMKITLPSDLAEQTAIASILSDMDAEIGALTNKLDKLRNIKQGMMSELLTGRIRLLEEV